MKPIIGIMNTLKEGDNNYPYDNYYKFIVNYIDRIKKLDGVPVGIFDCDNLGIYDGFLIPGGVQITEDHYKIIDYAIKHNKPCLGICAGMQAMILYDYLSYKLNKDNFKTIDLIDKYNELISNKEYILEKVSHHGGELVSGDIIPNITNINKSTHSININNNSILYDIYNKNKMDVISMHNYGYKGLLNDFNIIAKSDDNVVEAIIHKNKCILGVQFHIELENNNKVLIRFIDRCKIDK